MASWKKNEVIYVQQDNAKPHVPIDDPDVVRAGTSDGWNIQLICQPPNSPDLNILDPGYFNAIQTMQLKENVKNVQELVRAVYDTYYDMSIETLDNIFLTLQKFMECVLSAGGSNRYKKPHLHKYRLTQAGIDLRTLALQCDREIMLAAQKMLQEYDQKSVLKKSKKKKK